MTISLILPNDSITMKPPYAITPSILKLITAISENNGRKEQNNL